MADVLHIAFQLHIRTGIKTRFCKRTEKIILCDFCVNYLSPQIRNTLCLIRECEAFKETNFTRVFFFLIYDVYVTTVSSLNK